ncbi:hypothetical protein PILCRDRAFT_826034 [Piloderma croceum F 1598]|uniref:DUF6534 domain-containing protein n=1 Tax=Piloderma croceum (strain F 1598) TaxID=765440 RepID=A0A0C3ASC3_PILCF|nr:hypothetical protein PILCRDRAFT_826034 [Piloderma croceum F 1598]
MFAQIQLSLGAIYLGNLAAAIFYGVTCVQTFTYYQLFERDRLTLKLAVFFLWILDTLQMAMVSYTVYIYAVSDWNNPVDLGVPLWTFWAQVLITTISDFVIRCIYGTRIWILGNKNVYLTTAIVLSTLFVVAITFTLVIKSLLITSDAYLNPSPRLLYLSLGSSAVADIIIASTLCVLLFRNRTHIRKTNSLLNTLILYTICTGMLTGLYTIVLIVVYASLPKHAIFSALFASFSKMYFNALLASLNARHKLREIACNGDTIVFDTLRFGSPGIPSPSGKVYKDETDTRTSEHFAIDIGGQ